MKMKRGLSQIAAMAIFTVAISITGCGGGNGTFIDAAMHMTPDYFGVQPHIGKYGRAADQNDFNPDLLEWEYDNHEGLRIHLEEDKLYLDFLYNKPVPNIQFFIDIDNNIDTGNLSEDGADYMIENGYLYKSTVSNDWKWEELGAVKVYTQPDKRYAVAIDRTMLDNLGATFSINAQALTDDWHPEAMTPIDGSKSVYTKNRGIDWDSVPVYSRNGDKKVKLLDAGNKLFVRLEEDQYVEHIQIFIDSDNSASSGYKGNAWSQMGRDYLVEDGKLYRYTGVGNWGWEKIAAVSRLRKEQEGKDILEITIPKEKLTVLADKIKVGIETNNATWTDTVHIPQEQVPEFVFQGAAEDASVHISEVMAANTHTIMDPDYYNFSDWIELHNPGDKQIDIGGYSISDKLNKPKWRFPEGTKIEPHGYLLLWADDKNKSKKALHTNFKLSLEGEAVALFDREGKLLEGFTYTKQLSDVTVTEKEGKLYYMNPTPGKSNTQLYASAVRAKKPIFSLDEGFYSSAQSVSLSTVDGGTIYYTTDGSIPTVSSAIYSSPIVVDKTTVLRAITFKAGKFSSKVVTKNYIIGEEGTDIAVISIAIDNRYLFDDTIGIYTIGTNGKEIVDCGDDVGISRANFMQKWERPAHMTMFENDHSVVLSQDFGLKIAGECSRISAQKSLQLKADDKYGKKQFAYKVFRDKPIKKFKRLKLRNAGQDFAKTHMRDALQQQLAKGVLHVNYEAYRPAIVFINGDYWGVFNIREKIGKEYLEENYGEKKVNLLEDDRIVKEGSSEEYDDLVEYLRNHSLASDENYQYVASKIDIDNYIDYMILNIYTGNADWPGTNLVYWKPKKGGKWQWLLHDMDFGFARYSTDFGLNYNALAAAKAVDGAEWPNPEWSTLLFRKLLEHDSFKAAFKNRFETLLDTTFSPSHVKDVINTIAWRLDDYMLRHIQRWRDPETGKYSYAVNSLDDWEAEVQKLRDFADQRPAIVRQHIQEEL
jgi:hypothetical protein